MESEHVKENSEHVTKNPDFDGKTPPQAKIRDFSSASSVSSSSSSSSSSSEFGIDEKDLFDGSSAKSKSDGNPLSDPESVSSPDITTTHTPPWSMLSTSPPTGPSENTSPENSTRPQMKSPPIQTMGQPAGYDPNRIPASVFSTKATNPSEWSVASNESLFSIHMGNNSFSRDVAIMFGKSGELPKLDDQWSNPHSNTSLPPVIEVPAHEESCVNSDKVVVSRLEKQDSDNSLKRAKTENHAEEKKASNEVVHHLPPIAMKVPESKGHLPAETNLTLTNTPGTSTSNPRLSDESGNSSSSFAFPVLVSDGGKTGSLKGVAEKPEKPELQTQVSKALTTRWFSWFSCWPRCC